MNSLRDERNVDHAPVAMNDDDLRENVDVAKAKQLSAQITPTWPSTAEDRERNHDSDGLKAMPGIQNSHGSVGISVS